jgi:hypothetical protein
VFAKPVFKQDVQHCTLKIANPESHINMKMIYDK